MQGILDERCDSNRSSESTGASADPTTQQVQQTSTVRGRGRGEKLEYWCKASEHHFPIGMNIN